MKIYTCFYNQDNDIILIINDDDVCKEPIGFMWKYSSISETFEVEPKVSGLFSTLVEYKDLFTEKKSLTSPEDIIALIGGDFEKGNLGLLRAIIHQYDREYIL